MSSMRTNRHGSATVTLPSDREILIARVFDAPARHVFRAYTTPDLVKRWWGFPTSEWLVCENDLRVGGKWRYVIREQGHEVGFHGVHREVEAPHRLVSTEVFEGFPGGDEAGALTTVEFDEQNGATTMRMTVLHADKSQRDAHLESGMEGGMQISMDRLEDLVALHLLGPELDPSWRPAPREIEPGTA
jgi:uncharacterized protein YndB with AHSA1/START domain